MVCVQNYTSIDKKQYQILNELTIHNNAHISRITLHNQLETIQFNTQTRHRTIQRDSEVHEHLLFRSMAREIEIWKQLLAYNNEKQMNLFKWKLDVNELPWGTPAKQCPIVGDVTDIGQSPNVTADCGTVGSRAFVQRLWSFTVLLILLIFNDLVLLFCASFDVLLWRRLKRYGECVKYNFFYNIFCPLLDIRLLHRPLIQTLVASHTNGLPYIKLNRKNANTLREIFCFIGFNGWLWVILFLSHQNTILM